MIRELTDRVGWRLTLALSMGAFIAAANLHAASPAVTGSGWDLVFADEFEGSSVLAYTPSGSVTPPQQPVGVAVRQGNQQVILTWTAVASAASYTISRSTSSNGQFTSLVTGITSTTYTDSSAVNGTTYYYTVTAVNAGGSSAASSQVTGTPHALQPYPTDASSLVLFHFDETGGSAASNSGSLGKSGYSVNLTGAATPPVVTGVLNAAGAIGPAAAFTSGRGIGWDVNNLGIYQGYQGDVDGATPSADRVAMSAINMGNGGQMPWTIEAMVYCTLGTLNVQQEIISTDSSATTRGFQFRINSAAKLELNLIGPVIDIQTMIPTTGTHAYAANTWFHVAATYDGTSIKLYWTRVDSGEKAANLISTTAAAVGRSFGSVTGPLCVGGENRAANGEFFNGRIDEVRISKLARHATAMQPAYLDIDADGLPDEWERQYFTGLQYAGADNPDGDGYTNAQELASGTNPNDAVSNPSGIDLDVDRLPDSWEESNLGGLAYGPYDDPDADTCTNIAELIAATNPLSAASHPSWVPPRVTALRDSTVTGNACLMPSSAPYGRAINGISFQKQILQTFNGYQYTAWYDTAATTQTIWLARRSVNGANVGSWDTFNTGSEFLNGDEGAWDAHNVIALGICPADGTLHLVYDHHGSDLRYRRSIPGLCTTATASWGPGMLNAEQNWLVASGSPVTLLTYPQFIATPSGGLLLDYRYGISGDGDQILRSYNPISNGSGGNWTNQSLFMSRTGTYQGSTSRCAYINGLDFDPDGKIHVTWTWREGAGTSNHDICYAYSADNGVTWRNNADALIADTASGGSISLNSTGIIVQATDVNQLLINQQSQNVDQDGRVHVLMLHRREDPGYEYPNITTAAYSTIGTAYYHYFRDPVTGTWSQRRIPVDAYPVGSRPKIVYDANGNVYAAFLSYTTAGVVTPGYSSGKLIIASASKASQFTDWAVVAVSNTIFNGEPLIDQSRLLSDNVLSIYIQETSATSTVVGTPLHVIDYLVSDKPSDLWNQQQFGANWNVEATAGIQADPDKDGVVNLLERAFGGNPNAPDQNLMPAGDSTQPLLTLTYRKSLLATDLQYQVEESSQLDANSWLPAAGSAVVASDDGLVQVMRFTASSNTPRKFLRVKVTSP